MIVVIGAGPCGITVAKNLLQQGLTRFIVFEKNSQLGGNWLFGEDNSHSSVYETTHIISSKRLSAFEDFPMPESYPDYPSHAELLAYFNAYADHFGVRPYIQFNTDVSLVTRDDSNQWHVVYRHADGEQTMTASHLVVANGHHWDPRWPSYPGVFHGQQMHSHDYKKAALFKNKRVLVVGGGNSACDIAVETARVALKTCISLRSGQHIMPKFIFGKPTDVAFASIHWLPRWVKQWLVALFIRLLQGRYAKYQLKKPRTKPLEVHPTINSELLYFIRHGKIFPRDGIACFDGEDVYFTDGQHEPFDVVIYATGYQVSFPFFAQPEAHVSLYQKMIHPTWDNLFFIGLFQPQGCIWPLADHQAKIAARMMAGVLARPQNIAAKIAAESKAVRAHFKASPRHQLEVDYHEFRRDLLTVLTRG